jgi:hypothetical protein
LGPPTEIKNVLLLALGIAYAAIAAGFFALITRTATPNPEEARPMLYLVEGNSDQSKAA